MKTLKSVIFVLCVLSTVVSAQEKGDKRVTVGKNSYVVKTTNTGLTSVKPYSGSSAKISASSEKSAELTIYKLTDKLAVVKAFNSVFSRERLKQLISERAIVTTFKIDTQTGKVNSLSYMLRIGSTVSVSDIDKLSDAIKKRVTFVLDKGEIKGCKEVSFTYMISTEKISDGSFTINN